MWKVACRVSNEQHTHARAQRRERNKKRLRRHTKRFFANSQAQRAMRRTMHARLRDIKINISLTMRKCTAIVFRIWLRGGSCLLARRVSGGS